METWWIGYDVDQRYNLKRFTGEIVQSVEKPAGFWWGPYHCKKCAETCASFGVEKKHAFQYNHGTPDEKFGVFLSCGGDV